MGCLGTAEESGEGQDHGGEEEEREALQPTQGGFTWSDGIFWGRMKGSFGLSLCIAVCAGQGARKSLVGRSLPSTHPGA